jgi:chaperonin cofactor prefoldin
MNAHLKRENELIKARCDSQERQQKLMQKQIAELTAAQQNRNADRNMTPETQTDYNHQ